MSNNNISPPDSKKANEGEKSTIREEKTLKLSLHKYFAFFTTRETGKDVVNDLKEIHVESYNLQYEGKSSKLYSRKLPQLTIQAVKCIACSTADEYIISKTLELLLQ